MNPNTIRTIPELISYCRAIFATHPEHMTPKEQTARIVGACLNENREQWELQYPQLEEVLAIASNLEWGNVGDAEEAWARLKTLIDEVDALLSPRVMILPGELTSIQEVVYFLRQELTPKPGSLPVQSQENIAASIVGLGVNDKLKGWSQQYKALDKILDLATDLEWGNLANPNDAGAYWQSIEELTNELEHEISEQDRKALDATR